MEWHVGQDDAVFEQERGLQHKGPLIVQDTVPPVSRENFRDHDGDPGIRFLIQEIFDVVEEGTQDRTLRAG